MHFSLSELAIDLVNNSVQAGADRIDVGWDDSTDCVRLSVRDNGAGMDEPTRERATDPFFTGDGKHPGREIGLGIPFMVQTAESVGGTWWLESERGVGTSAGIELPVAHADTPPNGDLVSGFALMLGATGGQELVVSRTRGDSGYVVKRSELVDALGQIDSVSSLRLIESYVSSLEEGLWDE